MLVDYLRVFITGGVICALVQLLMEKTKMMPGRLSHPSNSLRVSLGTLRPLKARKSLLLGGNGGTDLPGFPTFRQASGQSRNPPPIEMLKTPSSRETIGRRRGKVGHAAAAR